MRGVIIGFQIMALLIALLVVLGFIGAGVFDIIRELLQ